MAKNVKNVRERFNELYKKYAPSKSEDASVKYRFIRQADRKYLNGRAASVLDVGFGDASLIKLLNSNYTADGLDISKENVSKARKLYKKSNFFKGDMKNFKLKGKYDIITCVCAIDHGDDLREQIGKTIWNFARHLNKKGIIIFDAPLTDEIWAISRLSITEGEKLGERGSRYAFLIHKCKDKKKRYLSYSIHLRIKGKKIEHDASDVHETPFILNIKDIKKVAGKNGFRCFVYDGWKGKIVKGRKVKHEPVFVLVRKG